MTVVLAALDDSVAAGPVLAAAAALAPLLGSSVSAVHVGYDSGATASACADQALVPFGVVPGDPVEQLPAIAADPGVTAVVIGSRSRAFASAPVGHLTLALADTSPRPLLVVPPECVPSDRIRSVVVALEGGRNKRRALRHALTVVAGEDVALTVVHVRCAAEVPRFSDSPAHESGEYAREFLARFWPGVPPARVALPVGEPVEELLAVVNEVRPDVLVAGWPQQSPGHGRVVRELLRRSLSPVLLVAVE